jgi:hypothetical protein
MSFFKVTPPQAWVMVVLYKIEDVGFCPLFKIMRCGVLTCWVLSYIPSNNPKQLKTIKTLISYIAADLVTFSTVESDDFKQFAKHLSFAKRNCYLLKCNGNDTALLGPSNGKMYCITWFK